MAEFRNEPTEAIRASVHGPAYDHAMVDAFPAEELASWPWEGWGHYPGQQPDTSAGDF